MGRIARLTAIGCLAPLPLLAGCAYDEVVRSETMTAATGNAIAYNSALQIIDPAPLSSVDTMIVLPAASYGGGNAGGGAGFDGGSVVGATQ